MLMFTYRVISESENKPKQGKRKEEEVGSRSEEENNEPLILHLALHPLLHLLGTSRGSPMLGSLPSEGSRAQQW